MRDADVACRQFGYAYALNYLHGSQVPQGSGCIWLTNVACTGKEGNLTNCAHRPGWEKPNCKHSEDAGVECSATGKLYQRASIFATFKPSHKSPQKNIYLYLHYNYPLGDHAIYHAFSRYD